MEYRGRRAMPNAAVEQQPNASGRPTEKSSDPASQRCKGRMGAWMSRLQTTQGLSKRGRVDVKYAEMLSTYSNTVYGPQETSKPSEQHTPALTLPGANHADLAGKSESLLGGRPVTASDVATEAFCQALLRLQWHLPGAVLSEGGTDQAASLTSVLDSSKWQELLRTSVRECSAKQLEPQQHLEEAMNSLQSPAVLDERAVIAPDNRGQNSTESRLLQTAAEQRCNLLQAIQAQECTRSDWPGQPAPQIYAMYKQQLDRDMGKLQGTVCTVLKDAVSPVSAEALQALKRAVETTVGTFQASVSAIVSHEHVGAPKKPKIAAKPTYMTSAEDDPSFALRQCLGGEHNTEGSQLMDYSEQEQEEAVQAANEAANGRRQTQCLVQLHMWMLLMAHTERMLKTSLDSDMHALVSSWQAGLDSSTQLMGFQMTKNCATLEWKKLMVQAMQDAKQEICTAEGQTRMQALKVTDLEDKVSQLNAQLATESGERQAAEATVLDLITLHLQVSELRERLAHEMQAGTELKEDHQETLKTTDNLREEVRNLVSEKAGLTAQLMAARSEISLMGQDIDRVERHARLADSTKKLDQDEVKRLQKDLDTMQGVHMEDTKHLRELDLKLKLLEEEISDMGQVLAKVHASEAALLSQEVQLKESNARLEKSLDEETKANEKAQMLIREYEKGVEKRIKKLESENESKTACISLLEEEQKEKLAQMEKMQQDAREAATKHRQKCLQLEASLELKVAARVKESSQEIAALNSLLNKMREEEVNQTAKHKDQLEKTRKLAQERVATAQAAVAAAQKSTEQLQEKAAMQLKDANNKVHQAEAKLLAVETKAATQSKTAKMRILTLEASIADLKKSSEDLQAKILELEAALDAKQGEVDDGLGRESLLSREIATLKAQIKDQRAQISTMEDQHKEMLAGKLSQLTQLQESLKAELQSKHDLQSAMEVVQADLEVAHATITRLEEMCSEAAASTQAKLEEQMEANNALQEQLDTAQKQLETSESQQASLEEACKQQKEQVETLKETIESLKAENEELHTQLGAAQIGFRDDDSAEGDEGSRPSSRNGRSHSCRATMSRADAVSGIASASAHFLPPLGRSRHGTLSKPGSPIGRFQSGLGITLPIQRIGDSIFVNPEMLTPGWHLSENELVFDAELAMDDSDVRQTSKAESEFQDASAALLKTVGLLQANETRRRTGNCGSTPGDAEAEAETEEPTSDSQSKWRGAADNVVASGNRGDSLVIGGTSVGAGIAVKVGRMRADRGKPTTNRKP